MNSLTIGRRQWLGGASAVIGASLLVRRAAADPALPAFVPVGGHMKSLKFRMDDVETGKTITEAAFRGHPTILYFGFTRCPDSCPLTMQNAAHLVSLLGNDGQRLRIAFVTVDLDYDTPARLKQFMAQFGPPPVFTGLRGTPSELKTAAARFGVFYKAPSGADSPDPVSGIGHSDATYLFAPDGHAVAVLPALPTGTPQLPQVASLVRKTLSGAA
ncbi:MAG: photosynthetic protein synthase I [Acidiphilium sp. 37-64-53]|uniref:SCO family protein n=1 Tax=Acidiphilium TaxID=522 RepID=UPI000BD6C52A|nr:MULTISPECIES: SCO family protein [Acidiphilium]OYW02585.1 MAG: photosynthetic protein synthase I [Acidiphilium sp. 37-64-53]OZB29874.1 MAG: photosynthetic protein synthase I [Acidiphilium sp. 34-64-41]HQT84034.1 SCO family protein [Acidiphilium rubrum]